MRNAGGALAQRKLTREIISTLKVTGRSCQWLHSVSRIWAPMPDEDPDIELYLRGLWWRKGNKDRTLLFNFTVPLVKNNIDLCVLDCSPDHLSPAVYSSPKSYVALGELKGGIDPAEADEHWKTARTALSRIQQAFGAHGAKPHLFFIGAAIEKKMSVEIWDQLKQGALENAANLTAEKQLVSVSQWLCNL
jgi:hypothetical protein